MSDNNEQQVSILDSKERLQTLIAQSSLPINQVFNNYVETLPYQPIEDFRSGLSWFNTSEPLFFRTHLKGKLVLLDFFTYCCINCMHILPDLKDIERTFSVEDGLVVIGVHSAKFANEKRSENVRNAVLRYNIQHPVVNDEGAHMWAKCDVHCWPTLLLISPDSRPLLMLMGEGHKDTLITYIRHFLDHYKTQLSFASLPIDASQNVQGTGISHLHFPGKLTIFEQKDSPNKIICISDSGNNRIIVIQEVQGKKDTVTIIGGSQGFKDGNLKSAQFNQPQGVVFLNENVIFVADTENHAIRRVDLKQGTVTTVAGNGVQSNDKTGGQKGRQQGISSPWDLEICAEILLIAMAGTHQIWALFLKDTVFWKNQHYTEGTCICIAGTGREENRNNSYPQSASFAQPSGLSFCHRSQSLYIADSESSTVRKLSMVDGKVMGIVGGDRNPNNLFAFGDRDGIGCDARLQHCIGVAVAVDEQHVFVADTYNHKIKVIDAIGNAVHSITSTVTSFNEPCDVHQTSDGKLYVADTNNHVVKVCKLNEGFTEIIDVYNLHFNAPKKMLKTAQCPTLLMIRRKMNVMFHLSLSNLKWNAEGQQEWKAQMQCNELEIEPVSSDEVTDFHISVGMKQGVDKTSVKDELEVDFQLNCCSLDSLCLKREFRLIVPINVTLGSDEGEQIQDEHVTLVISQKDVKVS